MKNDKLGKATFLKLSPDVHAFRKLHEISVADEIMQSAHDRYLRSGEVTILASCGYRELDVVAVHHEKPGADCRNARMKTHLTYAQAFQAQVGPITFDNRGEYLPIDGDDRLRLFIAFRILIEATRRNIGDSAAHDLRIAQKNTLHTIIDLFPNTAVIHGRISWNRPTKLERFGVARVLKDNTRPY